MRRVLVINSGRADLTPLSPVIEELGKYDDIDLFTGNIGADELGHALHRAEARIKSSGPDIMVLLGDRYETLMAAAAATYYQIPICHIHGGEVTYGSFDNQIRFAISALSHLHCTAAEAYSERLRSMGEQYVWTCGAPGLDNLPEIYGGPPEPDPKTIVVTYHPETAGDYDNAHAIMAIRTALEKFPEYSVLWTKPNRDPGSLAPKDITYVDWSAEQYLRAVFNAACVVGNSSSGIIEAPTLSTPTVNVGRRQEGRLKAPSVFDAQVGTIAITEAIRGALRYDGPWWNPHEPGGSRRIAAAIRRIDLDEIRVKTWRS